MVNLLLSHSWKRFKRSASFSKDTATLVFTAILGLMMFVYAMALGLTLDIIIIKGLKQSDAISFLNSLLLYYFTFEFIMRYMMQNLPVLDVQPYLHLPMKKSGIVNFLLIRSAVHLLNVLPLILFMPFALKVIAPAYSLPTALLWGMIVWVISMTIHFLVVLFKKTLDDNLFGIVILLGIIVTLGAADYYGWFKLSDISASTFNSILQQPALAIVPFALLTIAYWACYKFFRQAMYPEEISYQRTNASGVTQDFSFLKNFGLLGEIINVEAKLILRNKRPRNILYLSAFFLLYGLIFYTNDKYATGVPSIFIFVGIFVTGIFMISYGQLLFSWQGGHYDFTLTRPVSMRQYVESKYWLLSLVTIVCFILSTPYAYFGWNVLFVHLATMLFNIGINIFVIFNLAMWDPKKVDLKKSATFNYEGVGIAQWIMSFPTLLGPYLFYLPFSIFGKPELGIMTIALAGIIGIIFRNKLIDLTTKRLIDRKYKIAAGFRKD
ncbi:MAG TPA: DUF5687 family protein [Chryseosolibacter sp.]